MKKVALILIGLIVLAIPMVFAGESLSTSQAAQVIQDTMKKVGYKCVVEVSDVDENGVMDFGIEYISGGGDDTVLILIAKVTGVVAGVLPNLSWKVDKVYVVHGENVWHTTASKCKICSAVVEDDDSTDKDVEDCLMSIWQVEETGD